MKYLGIDYGVKRLGLALSDGEGKIAFPHSVIQNNENIISDIKNLVKREGVGEVVVGESNDFHGNPNKIMKEIEIFVQKLREEFNLIVHLEPEFLTSIEAERVQGKNNMHDASAAAIILQSFLDKRKNVVI